MRKIGIFVSLVLVLALGFAISSSAASKYAAKVNGVKVKSMTLEAAVDNFIANQKMMGMQTNEGDRDKLRAQILEELISAELLYQESKKAGLDNLNDKVKEQFENIKKGFASKDEFKKVLKERGVSEKELKNDIKKGLYIKAFLDRDIYAGVTVSEQEKQAEYEKNKDKLSVPEQVKASHILIMAKPDASDEDKNAAKAKIEDLRRKALSGEDFAELAKANSQDGSASNGGDLGYFGRGAMVKPFEDAAFSLEAGQISQIVETQFGYHILKVTDKQEPRTLRYEEVAPDIERFLLNQRRGEVLQKFVTGLRSKAKIEVY
ncbi:MAG: peptidylprolyl isomerase [Candidatus Gorgyraea atricola]|nr:peptidylprolyl isomerase [Candidatus Gorgyraea atricola]